MRGSEPVNITWTEYYTLCVFSLCSKIRGQFEQLQAFLTSLSRYKIIKHIKYPSPFCLVGFFVIALSLVDFVLACELSNTTIPMKIGPHSVTLELAINPESRACGLSNRQTLPDNYGMLFVFPYEKPLSFWMHDTDLPLSIVLLDSEKTVIDRYEMLPSNSEIIYRSKRPGLYAVEMPEKWFVSHGVELGDKLNFTLPDALDIR